MPKQAKGWQYPMKHRCFSIIEGHMPRLPPKVHTYASNGAI